ncbi:MAG: hypothetical protein JO022_20535 [Acidobacteriaceae bacterium]|nr:hypothetical protein [Acidobacteriaceae bacterium]
MARGWESKSVESQIESAESRRPRGSAPTAEQIARQRQKESLELSKTRILHDLERATNPRYRETLLAALTHLEQRLAEL